MAFDSEVLNKNEADLAKAQLTAMLVKQAPSIMKTMDEQCPCVLCARQREEVFGRGPMPEEEALPILKKARARIARGWTRGQSWDGNEGVCSMAALLCAIQGAGMPLPASVSDQFIMEKVVAHLGMRSVAELIAFNDRKWRTKEEVLRLFDMGIAKLEGSRAPRAPLYAL